MNKHMMIVASLREELKAIGVKDYDTFTDSFLLDSDLAFKNGFVIELADIPSNGLIRLRGKFKGFKAWFIAIDHDLLTNYGFIGNEYKKYKEGYDGI